MESNNIIIRVATPDDKKYATIITDEMESSAKARGTGIAKRSPEYIEKKIEEGKAVIAVTTEGEWVGFCYIEEWSHGKFVANSGLIVVPAYRKVSWQNPSSNAYLNYRDKSIPSLKFSV